MRVEGVAGVMYKVGKVIQVWVGRGMVVGMVVGDFVVKAVGVWGWCIRWGSVRRSQGLDPLRHFSDGGDVRGSTQRSISQGGDPAGLELGAGWVEVALARRQTMGRSYLDDTA